MKDYHGRASNIYDEPRPVGIRYDFYRTLTVGLILFTILVAGGATCARRRDLAEFAPPIVFKNSPTLEEIAAQLNKSQAIQRLESPAITISSPELITKLQGNLVWQSPSNFRLQAYPGTRLMGTVLDAGSNNDVFWLQTQMPPPPTIYYARHDEFESQIGPRPHLPVSPLWLKEAFGVIALDPTMRHDGPVMRADGNVQVQSWIPTQRGEYRRLLVIDPQRCVVIQTVLYDAQEKLVAHAFQSDHKYHASVGISLPRKVQIELQPDKGSVIAFTVDVEATVNQTVGNDEHRFTMPDTSGLSIVNLVHASTMTAALPVIPPAYSREPSSNYPGAGERRTIYR